MESGNVPTILLVLAMVFLIGGLIFFSMGNSLTGEIQNVYVGAGITCIVLGIILFLLMFVYLFSECSGGSKI